MDKIVSIKEVQELDRIAIEECQMPSIVLMENAGKAVARVIEQFLVTEKKAKILVVCGTGNNGGDGFVVARHLWNAGFDVNIVLIENKGVLKRDAFVNYQILKNCDYPIYETDCVNDHVLALLHESRIIVDAIFGVGLNREVVDPHKEFIEKINESQKEVVSVDIPSGLNGDTGGILNVCIKAKLTVTFSFVKKGFNSPQGKSWIGELKVIDIGIPHRLYERLNGRN